MVILVRMKSIMEMNFMPFNFHGGLIFTGQFWIEQKPKGLWKSPSPACSGSRVGIGSLDKASGAGVTVNPGWVPQVLPPEQHWVTGLSCCATEGWEPPGQQMRKVPREWGGRGRE